MNATAAFPSIHPIPYFIRLPSGYNNELIPLLESIKNIIHTIFLSMHPILPLLSHALLDIIHHNPSVEFTPSLFHNIVLLIISTIFNNSYYSHKCTVHIVPAVPVASFINFFHITSIAQFNTFHPSTSECIYNNYHYCNTYHLNNNEEYEGD